MISPNDEARWQLLQLRVSEKRVVEAVDFLRRNNVEPILIKGWAAAQWYPKPHERGFTDIDLMLAPAEYDKNREMLENCPGSLPVDLHRGARHLDPVPYEDLFANSRLVRCGETDVRVLRPEDHLRILCVHWLTDGGAYKIRLWDIYHIVENRPADFDWERCLNVVATTRRQWIVCTILLAHKYFGLKIEDTPAAGKVSEIPGWLIKTLEKEWASGVALTPLHQSLRDKKQLWRQIKKRFPPNAIQATVEMEGEFDDRLRIFYQIADVFLRLKPSVKRILKTVWFKK